MPTQNDIIAHELTRLPDKSHKCDASQHESTEVRHESTRVKKHQSNPT